MLSLSPSLLGSKLRSKLRFFIFVAKRFDKDGCTYRASALTFTSLLSLVPLFAISFAIFSAFPMFQELGNQVKVFIFTNLVASSGEVIQKYLNLFLAQASHLSLLSLTFLIVTSVMMLYTIEQALNTIWRVPSMRRGIYAIPIYWAILTLAPLFLGLGLATSSYLFSLHWMARSTELLGITPLLLALTPFVLTTIGFSVLYIVVPNCHVPLKNGIISGIIAAVLFETAKKAFTLYITFFANYEFLYGALSAVPTFLIWVYLSWLIVLLGAEISYALTFRHAYGEREIVTSAFIQAFYWLKRLWQAQQQGQGLTLLELSAPDEGTALISPQKLLAYLVSAKLIQPMEINNRYFLSRDLNNFSAADLYHILPWKLPDITEVEVFLNHTKIADVLKETWDILNDKLNIPLAELYTSETK